MVPLPGLHLRDIDVLVCKYPHAVHSGSDRATVLDTEEIAMRSGSGTRDSARGGSLTKRSDPR